MMSLFPCSPSVWLFCLYLLYKVFDLLLRRPRVGGYSGRYVLLTGCDSGFGRASAQRLEALGCHVFAGCLTEKGAEGLKAESCSDRLHPIRLDVSKPESVRRAFEYVTGKLPPGKGLWGLVNNAGVIGPRGRLEWATTDDYRTVNAVNLYGLIEMTTTFLPLVKRERGRVVNVCSMAGRIAIPESTPYAVSKFAAEAFSDSLRRSLAIYGCRVAIIEPVGFQTNINTVEGNRRAVEEAWNGATEAVREEFGEEYFKCTLDAILNIRLERSLDAVLDAYEQALFCRFPRPRYVVGAQGRFVAFVPLMPEWMADWVVEKIRAGSKVLPAALQRRRQR